MVTHMGNGRVLGVSYALFQKGAGPQLSPILEYPQLMSILFNVNNHLWQDNTYVGACFLWVSAPPRGGFPAHRHFRYLLLRSDVERPKSARWHEGMGVFGGQPRHCILHSACVTRFVSHGGVSFLSRNPYGALSSLELLKSARRAGHVKCARYFELTSARVLACCGFPLIQTWTVVPY